MLKLDEKYLSAILLCDPITPKGIRFLKKLNLQLTPEYYFEHVRVKSKFENGFHYETDDDLDIGSAEKHDTQKKQHDEIKAEYDKFMSRFKSEDPDTCPLLLVGVAGNGKTIEVTRQLWMMKKENRCDYLYFDLDAVNTEPFYSKVFLCPDPDNPIWLFCTKLLDGIMDYLIKNAAKGNDIFNTFICKLKPAYLTDEPQEELFTKIGALVNKNPETVRSVFESLISIIDMDDPSKSISSMLRILMYVLYCSCPNQKHYIVFDNIESFIKINKKNIQIPDGSLEKIYSRIKSTTISVINHFDRISSDLGWKSFKTIVVVRRTSLDLLEPRKVHNIAIPKENIADLTGHFQIDDIWEKKTTRDGDCQCVWDMIKNQFIPNEENEKILYIANIVFTHRKNTNGWSYQSMIAPLMSHGIRRNAKAQAHAIMCIYRQLDENERSTINYDTFKDLCSIGNEKRFQIRYMMRRALVEYQFKWAIYPVDDEENEIDYDESTRWAELGIGHLKCNDDGTLSRRKRYRAFPANKWFTEVIYNDPNNVTLLRRILTYLSYFLERDYRIGGFGEKTVVEMFKTISLYELMKGVLLNPVQREYEREGSQVKLNIGQLRSFARVLLALSNMSNTETKSAPYVILNLNIKDFNAGTTPETLAELLMEIWNKGASASRDGEYNCHYFGARITDAGHVFLIKWLPSFSYIASLYCYDIPPLFLLKDIVSIKHVINSVYNAALFLCQKYKSEAEAFCDSNNDLKDKMYLPKIKNKEVTFPNQIQKMHIDHLNLYRTYIINNHNNLGMNRSTRDSLISIIDNYIEKYTQNCTDGGDNRCF